MEEVLLPRIGVVLYKNDQYQFLESVWFVGRHNHYQFLESVWLSVNNTPVEVRIYGIIKQCGCMDEALWLYSKNNQYQLAEKKEVLVYCK